MITYAYMRVSTKEQNLDRQYQAIKEYRPDIPEVNIFSDKESGAHFEREQYQSMKIILEHVAKSSTAEGVEVVIKELDRLGRNADAVKQELQWFRERGIMVRILEIPSTLMDISPENRTILDMVNGILIEVYAALAQQELEKRRQRQEEGIRIAKEKGVKFGRRAIQVDREKFIQIYRIWKRKEITARKAMEILGIKENTFYRRVKSYESTGEL